MTLHFDLFWSFRSPYCYLVTPRIIELEKDYDVAVRVRPVYPIAIRIENFFKNINPLMPSYMLQDIERVAERLGLPFRWPDPDPVVMDITTGEVPEMQPHIHRLTRLGVAAAEAGQGLPFIDQVSSLIWGGTRKWHDGDHLAQAAARAGVDLAQLDAAIAADPQQYDEIILQNQEAQRDGGHWGVPLMVFEGEPFFGQDRFDLLKWRLEQHGLTRRG